MKDLKNIFTIAVAAIATIPGLSLLSTNLEIPPGESKMLYGGVLEAFSVMTLLIIWSRRNLYKSFQPNRVIKIGIYNLIAFMFFLVLYIYLLNNRVVDQIMFPFFPSSELKEALIQSGSLNKVISDYHLEGTRDLIQSSRMSLVVSKIIFLILFQMPFIFLISSFAILGIKFTTNEKT